MPQAETERLDQALEQVQADLEAASVAGAGSPLETTDAAYSGSSLTTRRRMWKPKKYSNFLNPAAAAEEARIAEKKRNRELYGDALEDVDFLRRCGWAINLTCDGRVKFGNQLLTLGELREKAERERRLRQPAPTPIGTTRVQA
jgi:hypothetical protein